MTFPRLGDPLPTPCPHSGLLGCDCAHDPADAAAVIFCDTAPRSIRATCGGVYVSASRLVLPTGDRREIVAIGQINASGVEIEPVELDPAGARALALALLDAADVAEVAR